MPTLTEPPPPAAPARAYSRRTSPAVRLVDKLTTALITAGGLLVIVAVVGILIYLVSVVIPLFRGATITPVGAYPLVSAAQAADLWALQLDEHRQTGYLLDRRGELRVFEVATGKTISAETFLPESPAVTAFTRSLRGGHVGFGFADGTIRLGRIRFSGAGAEMKLEDPLLVGKKDVPVHRLDYKVTDRREVVTVLKADGELVWDEVTRRENILTGKVTLKLAKHDLPFQPPSGRADLPDYLLQNEQGDQVYLAWRDGVIQRYDLRRIAEPVIAETTDLTPFELTSLRFMFGDQSLIAGDSRGHVTAWFRVHRPDAGTPDQYRLVPAHKLAPHASAVTSSDLSTRDKCFVTGTATGEIWLRHMTSDRVLGRLRVQEGKDGRMADGTGAKSQSSTLPSIRAVHLTPKGDAIFALDATGRAYHWAVHNPHPETTWKTIFGKTWYEGYDHPDYTWQSSSGNDDFEPKFSLIPLAFGTLKATVYSMLFAVPIALLAAIYTSQFLDKNLRMPIKSAVETMASLPSVVLGFIAALVLAPIVENWLVAVLLTFALAPLIVILGGYIWQMLPRELTLRWEGWPKFVLLLTGVLLAAVLSRALGGGVEAWLFAGDFKAWLDGRVGTAVPGNAILAWPVAFAVVWFAQRQWVVDRMARRMVGRSRVTVGLCELAKLLVILAATTALAAGAGWVAAHGGWDPRGSLVNTYVQRNTLVVGFVMGFAVIPIIYTISEDALSSVPEQLKSASLGCGATPWQTAVRVIVPVAMSGIFSAIMIGLGRAVGETMIVVMAAGNTPIMDLNIFNGLRALSANIAVELPEAVKDSTLFRMLFLAAVTLFIITFALNTVAEIIRQRFRKRAFQL
jgi:phosphate transport system permease protein